MNFTLHKALDLDESHLFVYHNCHRFDSIYRSGDVDKQLDTM